MLDRPISSERRRWFWLGLCVAILLPRAFLAVADQGLIWSDEIFQTLEQGHRLAFGYGLVPWEFRGGVRSWLLPGAIGVVMKALATVGVASGASLAVGLKLGFAALTVAAFYPMLRMAHAMGGAVAALLLGLCAMAFPASLVYGSRALAEVASAPFLSWGLWLLWPWGMGRAGRGTSEPVSGWARGWRGGAGRVLVAGMLLGLAAVLRYQNAILFPIVVIIVAARRSLRVAAWLSVGMILALLLGGLLDWVTWGKPFHALVAYLRFNLVEGGANQWGVAKRGFFLRTMLACNGPALLVLVLGFVAGLRRTWPIALLVLAFLVVHSSVEHKELRFLVPVLPLFLLCATVGLAALLARLPLTHGPRRATVLGFGLAMLAIFSLRARHVTFADIGQLMDDARAGGPTSSLVWRAFDERNRLLGQAGNHADLCGLAAPAMNPYWTGGYTYLHRRVPLLFSGAPHDFEAANYVLLGAGQTMQDSRYHPVALAGVHALYRRDGTCRAPSLASTRYGRLSPAGVPGT
jgi:GPI mannosyltransferase 3